MWLEVAREGETLLVRVGNDHGPSACYRVGFATVQHEVDNLRDCLNELARWGIEADKNRLQPKIQALVSAGYQLHYSLFDGLPGADRATALDARSWIAEQYESENDRSLRITSTGSVHIPWALVCERDASNTAVGIPNKDSFSAMWGLKYQLSVSLSGYTVSKRRLERSSSERRHLALVNEKVVEGLASAKRAPLSDLINKKPIGPARSLAELTELIRIAGKGDTVVSFFGHQDRGRLILSDENEIDLTRFKLALEALVKESGGPSDAAALVFLNACDGAHGDRDYSFVAASNRPGIHGFVSTEAAVPRNFAAIFVIKFFALIEKGVSVAEAMTALWQDDELWPLSLLYGCYAQPHFRFLPKFDESQDAATPSP